MTTDAVPRIEGVILDYAGSWRAGEQRVGGKAQALARLDRYGFRVPPGFVVPAEHYQRMLAAPHIAAAVSELTTCTPESCADAETAARLDALRREIAACCLGEELQAAIKRGLEREDLRGASLAVRSSAVGEDGRRHSFAGIHGSRLNVSGLDDVCQAVKACWASLWTPAALSYRRRIGLTDEQVACAVLVCRMVGGPQGVPHAAGVAFTCDAATGRRDFVVVNAVSGLADALVSGRTAPEQWTVDLREISPTPRRQRDENGPREAVLDERQTLELARIAERIHWAFGDGQDPQDIEWAHDGRRFWIVQVRPVTRVPLYTLEPVRRLPVVWSNANVKDAVPGVLRPLSWSGCKLAIDHILFSAHEESGYVVPAGLESCRRIDGRAMLDLTLMQWLFYDSLGMTPRLLHELLGGHQPELAITRPTSLPGRLKQLVRAIRVTRAAARLRRNFLEACAQMRRWALDVWRQEDFSRLDGPQLVRRMDHLHERTLAFGRKLVLVGVETSSLLLKQLLARYLGGDGPAVAAGLTTGTGEVQSAEHSLRLFELAEAARNSPPARELLSRPQGDPQAWRRLPESCPFRRQFAAFLDEFGHRAVYEAEVANPRWFEDPGYLLAQVRMLLAHPSHLSPREAARQARQRAEERLRELPFFLRGPVRRLARNVARAAALREAAKSAMAAAAITLRKAGLEVGRRMFEAGWLDGADDVFDLTLADLRLWLDGVWDGRGARELAAERRAQRAAWLALPTRDVVVLDAEGNEIEPGDGELPGFASAATKPAAAHDERPSRYGHRLHGVAASPGVCRATARVILHPEDGGRLMPGEILVAPSTDPGWTPLFLRAGAIVMQVGGYLSHGAIVAREFGLPAVVNVEHALTRIRDGQPVLVDGSRGQVWLGNASEVRLEASQEAG